MEKDGDKSATIEMRPTSVGDKDNTSSDTVETSSKRTDDSAADDRPPKPPKRDYLLEKVETQQITNNPGYASVNKRKKIISFPTRPEFIPKPEYADNSMSCLPNILVVFNLFIWILGAAITALGIWIRVDKEFWTFQENLDVSQFNTASYVLIIAGVIIMLVGFIGCYGACFAKIWMLVIFAVIVVILILMEIAIIAIVWSAVSNKNVEEDIKLKATTALHEMMNEGKKVYFINLLQSKLGCCGVSGYEDYNADEKNPKPIPPSCISTETGKPYETGCYDAVLNFFKSKAALVGGVAVAILLLQLGVLVLTMCLICGLKNTVSNAIF